MRNDYGASSLELLESEEYDKYRKNSFSENTYTKINSVPKTTALPSYKIPQKKVYTYSPPIPKVEKVETNVSKTPSVSSVELLESGNYSQKEIFGGEQKNSFNINESDNRVRKTYAESQVKSSPEISSLEYTEDYLPKQIKLPFESLIDNEKDEHIRKRLLPVLQTFDAAKYSPDFATKLEERYRTNEAYKKWIDESENILEDYARNHPDIDFSAAIDRIRMINGTWILHELIKMGEGEKLTNDEKVDKISAQQTKEKPIDFLTQNEQLFYRNGVLGDDVYDILSNINERYQNTKTGASKNEILKLADQFRENNYEYHDLTEIANHQLWENGQKIRKMKKLTSQMNLDIVNPVGEKFLNFLDLAVSGFMWNSLVDNGKKWDYKKQPADWMPKEKYFMLNGELINLADYGNINYGYTGTILGLSPETLYKAAGYVQSGKTNISDNVDEYYGDSEVDFANVKKGIEWANSQGYKGNLVLPLKQLFEILEWGKQCSEKYLPEFLSE